MLCLSISSTVEPAQSASKNFRTLQLIALKEMREAVLAAQKADDIMLREIDVVAKDLEKVLSQRMRKQNNQTPLQLNRSESARLANRLGQLVAENPYADNPIFRGPSSTSENVSEEDIFAGATSNNSLKTIVQQANQNNASQKRSPIVSSQTNMTRQAVSSNVQQGNGEQALKAALAQQKELPGGTRVVQTGSPMASPYAAFMGKAENTAGATTLDQKPQNSTSPFKPNGAETAAPPQTVRIKISTDPTISFIHANEWRKKMPEDWHDTPGTIHIVHNGHDSALIWGAGVEGKPVFDREKQRFKVVALRLGAH